jgi:hypothetical protein
MNIKAMDLEVQQGFSEIVDQFITQSCSLGTGLNISDSTLFPTFRAFWIATARQTPHPALLGQFRVELTERGYRSKGRKTPRWYGLTLHPLAAPNEKENECFIVPNN